MLVPSSLAAQQPPCQTNKAKVFLCKGDPAWATGYLVPPTVALECQKNFDLAAQIPTVQGERDRAIGQRDQALGANTLLENALAEQVRATTAAKAAEATAEKEVSDRYKTSSMVLATLAGFGVGLVAGGITVLILKK